LSCRTAHVCHIAGFFYPKWQANRAARMITTSASNPYVRCQVWRASVVGSWFRSLVQNLG
jgi:hypothetical protein